MNGEKERSKIMTREKKIQLFFSINSGITIAIYTVSYLVYSFIILDFRNPFQWIIDLSTYDNDRRSMILFFFLFYQIVKTTIVIHIVIEAAEKKLNNG